MIKRFILSFFLCFACVFSRADVHYDIDDIANQIIRLNEQLSDFFQNFWFWYDDTGYQEDQMLSLQTIKLDVHNIKETFQNVYSSITDLYPKLIQQYYHVQSIDYNVNNTYAEVSTIRDYLTNVDQLIATLQEVVNDYENFKTGITVPLNNIDANNTEMASYVRAIYEDVDTIKALFLGESNLREMLETLWDIKNDVEYFQQQWDLQNKDLHEMFLDPFDNSGFQESYEKSWAYFDRNFDPYWTWSNGSRLVSVQPSNWGALDDICSGLLAILQGNEAMNYNLEYLCQGVTIIASNLMNGVNMEAKYNEYKNEFQERSASAQQDYSSLIGYQDKFYIYKSPEIIHIHDTIRGHINETFSPFIVNEMPAGNLSLFGLSGFGDSGVDHVQGFMDMESFGFFFVAARFCFGFLYWILDCVFVWWCLSVAIKMYKMTLNWFTVLPQQVG